MNKLPPFSNYEEEGRPDRGYEALQDFFLSWTLRCATDTYKKDNFLINFYSNKIIFSLLYGYNTERELQVDFTRFESFKVLEVKTKRQFKNIDLLALIKIQLDDRIENVILNIENKWYTSIRDNQLECYLRDIGENFDLTESRLINVVIFCDDTVVKKDSIQIEKCLRCGYKFTNIAELASLAEVYDLGETGNYLFDEYWLRI